MTEYRPPYAHAAAVAGCALLVYVATLAPTTWFWDTSEYIATAYILGIPHPPGSPFFVVFAKVWSLLLAPTGLSVAVRVNLLASVTSAAASGFWFLVVHRVLSGWLGRIGGDSEEGPLSKGRLALVGAWCGAVLGATAFTVWNQSNVNEKVYTVSLLVIACVSWLGFRWCDRKEEPGSWWLLVLAFYLMVLGSTNHLLSLLPGPALLALVLVEKPRVLLNPNLLVRGVGAAVIGLAFNFVLPIRSAQQPMINEGEPVCSSLGAAAVAIYSLGDAGCPALASSLSRDQYGKPSLLSDPTFEATSLRPLPPPRGLGLFAHQLLNYFQYFDWQWARGLARSELPGNARLPFTLVFLGLGVWGLALAWSSRAGHVAYLGVLALTLTLGLVVYLNFKYGFSLGPEGVAREVRERDYFFVASFHLWGFLAGMGLLAGWRWAAGGSLAPRGLALASPVLLLAFVPVAFNWGWATRRGDYSAHDWAYNMLQSVEPYGVLFTNGDNDTFPLWYLQEVEGIRQDVTVIVGQYLYTDWYPKQLKYHTSPERQRPFRDDEGIGLYEAPTSMPSRPITVVLDAELDRVESVTLGQDQSVELIAPEASAVIRYPAGTQLLRGSQIALAIIRDSLGERPIHFASTGGMAQELGLQSLTVRQGIASKLRLDDFEADSALVHVTQTTNGEWLDFDRSLALAEGVFRYRGLEDRAIWADRASLNIPIHFYVLYVQLAEASVRSGRTEEVAQALMDRAGRFYLTAQGGSGVVQEAAQ
ncbi:MAG: DUF2723 domain-containing protein [Gemmatimonadetes bacterium]|nr:DUF2723 domain-containing protein [Gemmatimonadota bacterium]